MESSLTLFPKRPARDPKATGRPLKLFSNYFNIEFDQNDIKGVNKYTVKFEPEIPDNSRALRKDVLKAARDKIKEKLEFFIDWGTCLYSLRKVGDLPVYEAEHDGAKYKISIEWVQVMEPTDRDHMVFLKIFFNSMMRSLRFETIGPKSFNPAAAHSLDAHNIKVWPGFDAHLIMKERGALLNIDVAFRVVRTDSVLNHISQLREKAEQRGGDWQEAVSEGIVGCTVVTRYNQKTYKVDRVDYSMSPETTFEKDGKPVSYAQYYQEKYKENISDSNQPLLINKDRRTGAEVALVPELCQLTGLTDSMRADFRLMKDLAQIVHTNADKKVMEIKNLFATFARNSKCVEKQKQWHLKFKETPA
jgi:aubergine-like protein